MKIEADEWSCSAVVDGMNRERVELQWKLMSGAFVARETFVEAVRL